MHSSRAGVRSLSSGASTKTFAARLLLWVSTGTTLAVTAGPLFAVERYTGRAYGADQRLVYTETHWRYERDGHPVRLVLYRCPKGQAFARKSVVSGEQEAAPNFNFVDGRDGYREGVRGRGDARIAYWQEEANGPTHEKAVRLGADSVIDAGFDAWIQQQWPRLAARSVARAEFLVPSHARLLDLRVQPQPDTAPSTLRLRMGWDSWLGFAAPSVRLTYDTRNRRLRTFEGIGSVRNGKGKPWPVRIEFPSELVDPQVDAAEVAAAESAPLNGRCG